MKRNLTILATWLALSLLTAYAMGSGTTAADFLNIDISARQAAWGGAGMALDNTIAATYFNPAGLSMIERPGANLMHNLWYQDIGYEFFGMAMPIGNKSAIGVSAAYLHMGKIDVYDMLDQQNGSLNPYSFAGILSYSRKLSESFSVGIGARYITEKLADVQADGYAVDLGAQYYTGGFSFGAMANNLGPKMKYETESFELPSSVSLAGGYQLASLPLSFMIGTKIPFAGKASLSTGIEYQLADFLAVRSGYGGIGANNASNNFNLGAGINFMGGTVDYAFNPGGNFGATHFFSFTFSFGNAHRAEYQSNAIEKQNPPTSEVTKVQPPAPAIQPIAQAETKPAASAIQKPAKPTYVVSAGKFNDLISADAQIEMLKKLGVNSQAEQLVSGDYQVVLLRTQNLKKAEKLHNEAKAKGLVSFLETE